ncbi:putative bifunctional diguanylate cyclase/phosphodiesterase [Paraclostridium bifermentans]|uniref:putative bifunctional diguanylate cyclase/phosphodiesterase n=1 Tax=Paraclostridium bifermentans TaxID=1490 RepID=UPI00189CE2B7|nr:bifunctional diguanylate cyclase/phosphodiesterase [Paraclostridium bifermentans]
MIFTKKINLKIAFICIAFMTLLVLTNGILMEYGLDKSVEFTYNTHYKEAKKILNQEVYILKDITKKLAEDKTIISSLESNKSSDDLTQVDINNIISGIKYIQDYLKNLIFVNCVTITNIPGNYLFYCGELIENFDVFSNYKFENLGLSKENPQIISDVYNDPRTGKYEIAVINLIYSEESDEPLGIVVLDILLDDLIEDINSKFYMGDLNTYIKLDNNKYYSSEGIVDSIKDKKNNYVVKLKDVFDDNIDIYLEFDKDSIVYNRAMRSINKFRVIIFIILGTVYLLILILLIRGAFKPILKSLDKLKILLENLEKKDLSFEKLDEFEQLEVVSSSLGSSINKKIKSLIYYDELTQLPNRKLLFKQCNDLIKANRKFALIFVDLNKFKYINDVFGHSSGDQVLVEFSNRLKKCLKGKGIVSRYSGDEFIIIYSNYIDNNELEAFYNNVILKEFKEPIIFNNNKVFMDFAAGVSVYPKDGNNFNDLINKSDFMMYSSKKNNKRAKLLFFNDVIYNEILEIETMKEDLKYAVDNNEFVLYYQPIVDKNKAIKKLEALIRWNNRKLGYISPDKFIEYAEETGEIVKIGYWVIEDVCKNFNELFKSDDILQVSINVSPIQLMEVDFVNKAEEILNKYNVTWKNLCLEITETAVLDENIIIRDNLLLLNKKGVKIALDDFGTGYASFSYLKKFKLDILKIDRIFIDNGLDIDYKIVDNIKSIANLLNMETVIEGVETEEQFNNLKSVGCEYFQGYYFSRPLPISEINKILSNRKGNREKNNK